MIPLRVMLYDSTTLKDGIHPEDALAMSWRLGATLYRLRDDIDYHFGVTDWNEAFDWLIDLAQKNTIGEIQFWCHGSPGRVWLGKNQFNTSLLQDATIRQKLLTLRSSFSSNTLIWFRTCGTFAGESGQKFAKELANFLGCVVAGHTHIIGPFQSGLHTLKYGQEPNWSTEEGLIKDTSGHVTGVVKSSPWKKHTITCLRGSIPKGW